MLPRPSPGSLTVLLFGLLPACAGRGTGPGPAPLGVRGPSLPPIPAATPALGPLAIRVAYPREDHRTIVQDTLYIYASAQDRIQSRDTTFIFGSVGRGDARLTLNGVEVPVYPTGAWLAWVPLPDDTIARFDLVASTANDTARASYVAYLPPRFRPPLFGLWIDTTSFTPAGARWIRPGEALRLSVRAAEGAEVRVVLPDGHTISFQQDRSPGEPARGEIAFGTGSGPAAPALRPDRYVGRFGGAGPFGPDPGPVMAPLTVSPTDSGWAFTEVIAGGDTIRHRWPLRVGLVDPTHPPVVMVNDDTAGTGKTDSALAGRPAPQGVYHWFFPNGTLAAVSGRWNDRIRLQLSQRSVAWVDAPDVQPLHPDVPPPGGVANSPRLVPGDRSVTLRVPLPAHIPYRVDETERAVTLRLYGVAADMEWIRYGGTDPFVKLVSFSQPSEDETLLTVELADPVWGYRTRWQGNTLLLEIRRPPVIDPARPLKGRTIALDPGHPPAGATGPSGLREADVVLVIARVAKTMLDGLGANAVLVRSSDSAMDLVSRTRLAEQIDADLLISIHANALPDGVNPFVNSGTSVYYFHPRSAPLARELDDALVRQFGFRDLGMGRGDLALVRATWMPSALTEGLFIMLPDQEYWLASPEGQRRYAQGLVEGITAFLKARARATP